MEQHSLEHMRAEVPECELPDSFATDTCNQDTTTLGVISVANRVEEYISNL